MTPKRNRAGNDLDVITSRIRLARKASGLSQVEVGERLGLTGVGYGHLERGYRMVTIADLRQLSLILRRPMEYFLGLDQGLTEDEGHMLVLYRELVKRDLGKTAIGMLEALTRGG